MSGEVGHSSPHKQRLTIAVERSDYDALTHQLEERSAELEHEKMETEVVLHSLGEAMYVVDKDYIVRMMNPYAAELLGYEAPEEALGKRLDEAVPALDDKGNHISLERRSNVRALTAQQGDSVWSASAYFLRKSGEKFPVQVTTTAISIDGSRTGAITVFRDITRDKKIDQLKSEFIYLAAHQLRTPISVILLNLELMEKSCVAVLKDVKDSVQVKEMKQRLGDINSAARSVSELIDTLLNVSRIEMGTMELVKEHIDLHAALEEEVRRVDALAKRKQITFRIEVDDALGGAFSTDKRLLQIILQNLISNAVKYNKVGGSVVIEATKHKGMARVSIRDEGIGIPHGDRDDIFKKFFRSENIATMGESGVGLGLHLVRSAAEDLGGVVWYESVPGTGSTFYFEIPLQ